MFKVIALIFGFSVIASGGLASRATADVGSFHFPEKRIELIQESTGLPVADQEIFVYRWYSYLCTTHLVYPDWCVEGPNPEVVSLVDGRFTAQATKLASKHLTARKPRLIIQIAGTCRGQEWHPADCNVEVPLSDLETAGETIRIVVPLLPTERK